MFRDMPTLKKKLNRVKLLMIIREFFMLSSVEDENSVRMKIQCPIFLCRQLKNRETLTRGQG